MHPRYCQWLAATFLTVAAAFLAPPAQAQPRPGFTLNAALGGAVPYAGRESFVVAKLAGAPATVQRITFAGTLPLVSQTRPVFDARPQLVLQGGMPLAEIGSARLSLNAYLSTGVMHADPDGPRPLLGLAALRLLF
ncbi:hypothetical protein [Teichococcus oryzae]|uniref:DUF4402 domain-containing protein n=1 Tax=Teichococcus oryzae TaxID=1608942 RepID=A0A5B2TKL1_9PROT|nr:hypothetical protein [Pseudoroseomonas oryzae]KAA2214713.1 hypothetical protein F0Q34_03170 [Pseudoroseomonas oryzae]